MSVNKFDPANYPEGVPATLYSGDFWAFKFSDISAVYPPASYGLNLILVAQTETGEHHEIAAVVDADDVFMVEAPGNDPGGGEFYTGQVAPAEYYYKVQIVRTSDDADVTEDQGYTTVRPSLDAAGDVRSHNLVVLQAIRANIAGSASKEQASYSVAGRSLARRNLEELRELEAEYAQRWQEDKAALDRESGRRAQSGVTLLRLDA